MTTAMPVADRFEAKIDWARIDSERACWPWSGARDDDGYGMLHFCGKTVGAHRVSYELYCGPIPEGMCVLHSCDNPACCNPKHLYLGTQADNIEDCVERGRMPRGSQRPNTKLTEAQVISMRQRFADGESTQAGLAREYGVSRTLVRLVINRHVWCHV